MLKILQAPSQVLSQVAEQIDVKPHISSEIKTLIKEMEIALDHASDPKGVGLAAPQVGKSISMFIAKPSEKSDLQVFINPRIVSSTDKAGGKNKKKKDKKLEGCLSLQDVWGEVKRFDDVELEYFDEKGNPHNKRFSGFMSTIVQHEVDHLNGILFPKKVLEQKGQLYHSTRDEKGEMVFEPIQI